MSLLIYSLSLCIILLLGLILFAPIDIVFNVRGNLKGVDSRADVKWTLLSMHFSKKKGLEKEPDIKEKLLGLIREYGKKEKNEGKGEEVSEDGAGFRESFDDISTKARLIYGIRDPVFHLLKGILSAVHIRELSCDLDYGLPDPADTGMLCGYLHTLASVVHSGCRKFHYSVTPQFADERFDMRFGGNIRFRIASFIPPLVRFIFNRKILRTGWWFVRNRSSSTSGVSV